MSECSWEPSDGAVRRDTFLRWDDEKRLTEVISEIQIPPPCPVVVESFCWIIPYAPRCILHPGFPLSKHFCSGGPHPGCIYFLLGAFLFFLFHVGCIFLFSGCIRVRSRGGCTRGCVEGGGSRSAVRFSHFLAGGGFSDVEGCSGHGRRLIDGGPPFQAPWAANIWSTPAAMW